MESIVCNEFFKPCYGMNELESMLAHASHASAYYFIVSLYKKAFFSKYLKKYSYYDINF